MRPFPPRLPDQPIFYPVLLEDYVIRIARDWNVLLSGAGFVARFAAKIYVLIDETCMPTKLTLTVGQMNDIVSAADLIMDLPEAAMLLAGKG